MPSLTANELKTRGVTAIEEHLLDRPEAVISVRGKDCYVVMEVAQYNYLRECELDAALAQSRSDIAAGRFVLQSALQHADALEAMMATDTRTAPTTRSSPTKKHARPDQASATPRKSKLRAAR